MGGTGYGPYQPANSGGGATGNGSAVNSPSQPTGSPVQPGASVDLAALQTAVNNAYQALTAAIATGDSEAIKSARDKYSLAQKALEQAKLAGN
jgi:hypothetical protein